MFHKLHRMVKHFISLFSFCLFMISCSSPEKRETMDFSLLPEYTLEATQLNQDEIVSGSAWEFHRVGERFLVVNGVPNAAAVALRISDGQACGTFVRKGNGPGECLTPHYAGCSENEDTIFLYDRSLHNLAAFTYSLHESDTFTYHCAWVRRAKEREEPMYGPTRRTSNNRYVTQRLFGKDSLFMVFDENLNKLFEFGELPLPAYTGNPLYLNAFSSVTVADGNRFYYASKRMAYLASYTIHSNNTVTRNFAHTYVKPLYEINDGQVGFKRNNLDGFADLKVKGGYIWTLYNGNRLEDTLKSREYQYAQTLIVFDMDGIPLAKFKIPHKANKFCFSKDGETMYIFTMDYNIDMVKVSDILKKID